MPERKTCFTFELDERQQEAFLALLASGNYRPKQVPYSLGCEACAGRVAYALIGLYFGTRAFIRHHATR